MYKKTLLSLLLVLFSILKISANEISFTVEIRGITVNGGVIYGAIYSNNTNYRNHVPEYAFQGNSINEVMQFNLNIPPGEYVIEVYQDSNNNGSLDFGIFNIPREPVGITNFNGRGIPGNFNRQKVLINNGSIIIIQMYKL